MEARGYENGNSTVGVTAVLSSPSPPIPNYNSPLVQVAAEGSFYDFSSRNFPGRAVAFDQTSGSEDKFRKEALKHLASIDLIDLCNEAKVERCRATRDLRSCGRHVQHVLTSCGHASLCAECCPRCDICPICRVPIEKSGSRTRVRLYFQCIEAGLISKRCDDRFLEMEDSDNQLDADIQRLYSFFNVALENNLSSLICHYVTDVCMDESAVSSDPVIAFLLDEVVVKNWCRRTFKNIISELHAIYSLRAEEMRTRINALQKFSTHLEGISNVLEVLESSFAGSVSSQGEDLCHLQESILKTTQHMEIMVWCIRHQFLENMRSRHNTFASWRAAVQERKSAAIKRAWPDSSSSSVEPSIQEGSLFIEDALLNLDIEEYTCNIEEEKVMASLQKDEGITIFRSRIEAAGGSYPFENLRDATDILFLRGSSGLVLAKRAILLYYLFDWCWSMPDEQWRPIIDDFAAKFGITRHLLLESLTFYLLDDHTKEALQEAVRLLPEIAGPSTPPKVPQVLLERQNPDAALMVLRWSGHDGGAHWVSLTEAVISVRVRVESGLLTEAFMYQRMQCAKVKEKSLNPGLCKDSTSDASDGIVNWAEWVEALVTELCCLCIYRNFLDQMIDLPWSSEEEKYLHKCLFEYALENPSATVGSLLVSFYLKRYRYMEAYVIDCKLKNVEEDFISKNTVSAEVLSKMRAASQWRRGLVDKCIALLPEVQRQQLRSGKLTGADISTIQEDEMTAQSLIHEKNEPSLMSILLRPSTDSSSDAWMSHSFPFKPSISEEPSDQSRLVDMSGAVNHGFTSIQHTRLLTDKERRMKPQFNISKNIKFDDIASPGPRRSSPVSVAPLREVDRSSSRAMLLSHDRFDKQQNGFENASAPHSSSMTASPVFASGSQNELFEDSIQDLSTYSTRRPLSRHDQTPIIISPDDPMDASWSNGEHYYSADFASANGGMRWRSDESSEEEEPSPPTVQVSSRSRRSRLARR